MFDRTVALTSGHSTLATSGLVHGQAALIPGAQSPREVPHFVTVKNVFRSGTYMEMLECIGVTLADAVLPQSAVTGFLAQHPSLLPVDRGAMLFLVEAGGTLMVIAVMQNHDEATAYTRATPVSSRTTVSATQPMYFVVPASD